MHCEAGHEAATKQAESDALTHDGACGRAPKRERNFGTDGHHSCCRRCHGHVEFVCGRPSQVAKGISKLWSKRCDRSSGWTEFLSRKLNNIQFVACGVRPRSPFCL